MKEYKFKCTKDVFMTPSGSHAFVKGKTYLGIKDKSEIGAFFLKNEYNNSFHHMGHMTWILEFFTPQFFEYGK